MLYTQLNPAEVHKTNQQNQVLKPQVDETHIWICKLDIYQKPS